MKRKTILIAMLLATSGWVLSACSDDDSSGPECGNAVCEAGETADNCPADCGCGNGILNEGEECDGTDLNNETCEHLGYQGGTLSCNAQCRLDVSQCQGETLCGNGVIDAGEECDGSNLNGETCTSRGFSAGTLSCTDACHFDTAACCANNCDTENDTQCNGDVIQTCTMGDNGCLDWVDGDNCADNGQTCAVVDGTAQCTTCQDLCDTENDTQCNGDVIQTCTRGDNGCLDWADGENCADSGLACVEDNGTAQCEGGSSVGDTCANPIVISTLPYTLDGTDITADFADDYDWADNTGCDTGYGADGVDAVFSIDLTEGQQIKITEAGGLDAVLRVFETCDASAQCLGAADMGDELFFTAPSDGTYYIALEAWSGSPGTTDYNFTVEEIPPEADCSDGIDNDGDGDTDCYDSDCAGVAPCEATETTCGDGIDNDGDGDTDCYDSDCSGVAPCEATEATCGDGIDNDGDGDTDCADSDCFGQTGCTTENICNDGEDNDNDGDTDCDDSDCDGNPACMPNKAVYQEFGSDDPLDLAGTHLTFTPDSNDPMGYTWTSTEDGSPFAVTPGSGTVTQELTLGDDDQTEYQFSQMASFTFFGQDYTSLNVISNGFVTFVAPSTTADWTLTEFLTEVPKIAGVDRDLAPNNGGTITVDEFADRLAVTFVDVPRYGSSTETVTFQIVLHDDGVIEISYGEISIDPTLRAFAGITAGSDVDPQPDEVDFFTPTTETSCDDGVDNDGDGLTDCADSDCNGVGDCESPEATCDDGIDNDGDGLTDCADSDCNGVGDCESPETTCDDGIDNDSDGVTDCDDANCYGVGTCAMPEVVINEVRYDDDGADDLEFIELYTSQSSVDLSVFTLVHYNGSDGGLVWSIPLDGISFPSDGYLVIGDAEVENLDVDWTDYGVDSIQNGPDAVVLFYDFGGANEQAIDAMAYEGTASLPAFAYETAAADHIAYNSWNTSEGRTPNGTDTDDNSADFAAQWWPTPGEENTEANFAGWTRWTGSSQGDDNLPAAIPDNDATGINLTGTVPSWAPASIADIRVGIKIRHTYIGDLTVSLTSPQGTTVILHDHTGGSSDDIITVYPYETAPAEDLGAFVGQTAQGQWTLHIADTDAYASGEVIEWVLWFQ